MLTPDDREHGGIRPRDEECMLAIALAVSTHGRGKMSISGAILARRGNMHAGFCV